MLFFKQKDIDGGSMKCCFFSTMKIERWQWILGVGLLVGVLAGCTTDADVLRTYDMCGLDNARL